MRRFLSVTASVYPKLISQPRFQWMSTTASTTTASTTDSPSPATVEALNEELAKANLETENERTKYKELDDKYKRSLADSENLRMRLTKQIQEQKLFAIQNFCKDLTDIEDILRLAIDSVPKEKLSENKHLKELYEGLTMTQAQLLKVFSRHGLTQVNPIDTKFNPNEHEAVMQREEPGKTSGTVIFVSKLGYKLHDRVIRPAIVGVAK